MMQEELLELVDSGRAALRIDRASAVIRGVKLLGLASRNDRVYDRAALQKAVGLYEGARVNVNHPAGRADAPRDYQDRIGAVRNVREADDGLYGDFHFNPRHPLADQLVWDAEHAPDNVGFSHNVLARTTRRNGQTVVEEILQVRSVDLVADPATTRGLFEHFERSSSGRAEIWDARTQAWIPFHSRVSRLKKEESMPLTSETLNEEHREIREESRAESAGEQSPASGAAAADELARLTEENARLQAAQRETERRERVARLLEEARLPPALRTATFERLCFAADDAGLAELLRMRGEDARALTPSGKPVCVEQRGPRPFSPAVDAASFAAALR